MLVGARARVWYERISEWVSEQLRAMYHHILVFIYQISAHTRADRVKDKSHNHEIGYQVIMSDRRFVEYTVTKHNITKRFMGLILSNFLYVWLF